MKSYSRTSENLEVELAESVARYHAFDLHADRP